MSKIDLSAAQSLLPSPSPLAAEIELVRHFARLAAECDYKELVATGKIPHSIEREVSDD